MEKMGKCHFIKRKANCKPVKCEYEVSQLSGSYNLFCTSHLFLENRHTQNELIEMYGNNKLCNEYTYKYKAYKSLSSFFKEPKKKKKKRKRKKLKLHILNLYRVLNLIMR